MQDEVIEGEPSTSDDQRVLLGTVAAGVLVALIAIVAFWPFGEDGGPDEPELLQGADLALLLDDDFADDGEGGKSAALDELIEELTDRPGVDRVEYWGPATVTGIAPGAPTLSAYGHRLLVYVDGFAVGVELQLINEYKNRPGIRGVAQSG